MSLCVCVCARRIEIYENKWNHTSQNVLYKTLALDAQNHTLIEIRERLLYFCIVSECRFVNSYAKFRRGFCYCFFVFLPLEFCGRQHVFWPKFFFLARLYAKGPHFGRGSEGFRRFYLNVFGAFHKQFNKLTFQMLCATMIQVERFIHMEKVGFVFQFYDFMVLKIH